MPLAGADLADMVGILVSVVTLAVAAPTCDVGQTAATATYTATAFAGTGATAAVF